MSRFFCLFCLLSALAITVRAQTSTETNSDPSPRERFTVERWLKTPAAFQPQGLMGLQWRGKRLEFTFVRQAENDFELVVASPTQLSPTRLMSGRELAEALAGFGLRGSPAMLAGLRWEDSGDSLLLDAGVALFRVLLEQAASGDKPARGLTVEQLFRLPDGASNAIYNAGLTAVAFVKDFNVHVQELAGEVRAVTTNGSADLTHGVAVHRVEFGIKDGLWFSADGKKLAFYREDFTPIDAYPYVNITPTPAVLAPGRYPMAGRKSSIVSVGCYELAAQKLVWLATDPAADEWHTNVAFTPDASELWIAHVNRAQNHMELRAWSTSSGNLRGVIMTEDDAEWIEPEAPPYFVPGGQGEFLWLCNRSGWRQFHLFDASGKAVKQVTHGEFDVDEFTGFDADGKGFGFVAPGAIPIEKHHFHGTLEGAQRQLTTGRGHHTALISADQQWLLDTHTNLTLPKAVDLVELGGQGEPRRLHTAPDPLAAFEHGQDQLFTVKTEDGRVLYGWMMVPPGAMEQASGAPVIHYVYGGPHNQLVTDQWLAGGGRWNLWLTAMASEGHVVFFADGRGTPHRGIDWQQAVHRRLGTPEMEDQLCVLQAVLERTGADKTRVGVTGWSYGGFMTLTLSCRAGEHYKSALAGAPVTDWEFYETGYGERYMDTPAENPEGYKLSNTRTHVRGLKGRLMVVHGSADDTVVWQQSLAFLKACIDAGVDVDTMIYPGELHGLRGSSALHFMRKSRKWFLETL
jgi:dipeptidyl-peptidase-4